MQSVEVYMLRSFSLKLIHFGKDVKTTPNMSAIFVRFFARFSSIYIFLFVVSFVIIIVYNEPLADKAAEHTNQIETVLGLGAFPGPNAFSGRKKRGTARGSSSGKRLFT